MNGRLKACHFLGLFTSLILINGSSIQATPLPQLFRKTNEEDVQRIQAANQVPMEQMPPGLKEKVRQVITSPTLYSRGPLEAFVCKPEMYYWFIDSPDRTAVAWRRLGAKCLDIDNRGPGIFGWTDGQGSDVSWQTVFPGPNRRIWYAEGKVKPGPLLPSVPVQCVVILNHNVRKKIGDDSAVMQQQADVFVRTNSRTAALITRMLGPSIPRLAEQGIMQMQMFFGAMAWYCNQNPERVRDLLRPGNEEILPGTRLASPFEAGAETNSKIRNIRTSQ